MLDDIDRQAPGRQLRDQKFQQRRFAAAGTADDADDIARQRGDCSVHEAAFLKSR
jgi:hypothetical protein